MIKKYGDLYASIFLIAFAVVMYVATFDFQRLTVSQIGTEFVPQLTAIGIFMLSIALLVKGIKNLRQSKAGEKKEADNEQQGKNSSFRAFPVIATIGLLIFYIAFIREIGFLLMTVVYLVLQFYVLADKSKRSFPLFLTLSIAVSVSVYYIFRYGFNLMLPSGILG